MSRAFRSLEEDSDDEEAHDLKASVESRGSASQESAQSQDSHRTVESQESSCEEARCAPRLRLTARKAAFRESDIEKFETLGSRFHLFETREESGILMKRTRDVTCFDR